jgi:hypothetical protein
MNELARHLAAMPGAPLDDSTVLEDMLEALFP